MKNDRVNVVFDCYECDGKIASTSDFVKSVAAGEAKEMEHCPKCLTAKHKNFGAEDCRGRLDPVSVFVDGKKWNLILKCNKCGEFLMSPVNEADSAQKLLSIASKPLSNPPFPIEHLDRLMEFVNGAESVTHAQCAQENHEKGYYKNHACRDSFECVVCKKVVTPEGVGGEHRNHCPHCFSSLHVDNEPGDRASNCLGEMEAIAVWVRKNGDFALIHRCKKCGKLGSNGIAADDNPQKIIELAMRPFVSLNHNI